jgi:hypothetical protein
LRTQAGSDVPLATFQSVEIAVAVADELLDLRRQFARVCLAAVERRHFVSAAQRVTDLIRTSESGSAENQHAHRFHTLFCKQ